MDSILEEILKTEKEANKILDNAKFECEKIEQSIANEKKEIEINSKEKLENKLQEIEKIEEEKYLNEIENMEKDKTQEIENLKKIFLENHKVWIEKIIFNVIKQ